ncbi:hypothetical protein LUZ60_016303 [Juncus effusus]|nr:hypothetical protein LUZ60_016303 [Juncus effusus]
MDDLTGDGFFTNMKSLMDALDLFLHTSKKFATTISKPFTHDSRPVTVDEAELSKLKRKLEGIREALKKGDKLDLSDASDQLWMRELRDLEYQAENVVEHIQFESLKNTKFQEFKVELLLASGGKRRHQASALFSSVPTGSLGDKIKQITNRFREIYKDRKALYIRDQDGERRTQPRQPTQCSSFPTSQLQGRKQDMKKLTEWLSSDDANDGVYSVIPIVGMAGVGKTTLVQNLYHDKTIQSNFDLRIWVRASQQNDVAEITRRIVEGIEKTSPNLSELDPLQCNAIGHLKEKKFLLVLDDMWDEDPRHWDKLQVPLNSGAKGSKVIVTTRSMKVGKMMCPKSYRLSCLSDDISWLVCLKKACRGGGNLDSNMVSIGERIAARCKGLPLAAEAVGVSLSLSVNEEHWRRVLENYLLTEDDEVNKILPDLRVSYDHLPLHLKRCFAYCSLFPKGHIFQKDKLVHLWMAQGFIDANGSSTLEEIGCRYFDNLVERCFFQNSPSHYLSEEKYVMHDLYHELAETVSGEEYNRTEYFKMRKKKDDYKKARHSSMVPQETNYLESIEFRSFDNQDLRTFMFVGENKSERVPFSVNINRDLSLLLKCLECLRALDLGNTGIKNLPSVIGNLIHLRYLSVENTKIESLPESIVGLFNLQTLNLKHCYELKELPKGMKLLDNLRHLHLPLGGSCCISMPAGMGQMTNLQTLPLIVVNSEIDGCGVKELGSLEKLKGELHISGMDNVTDAKFAEQANMQNKCKLQKLTLEWSAPGADESIFEVVEKLKPHSNMKELIIKGFCGNRFPSWLGDKYLEKLASLELKDCTNANGLPSLGRLPSLKYLIIQSVAILRCIGLEFCGHASSSSSTNPCIVGFPKLETLVFKKMNAWEEWTGVEKGDFPCLESLILNGCEKLHTVPQLPTTVNVKVIRCPSLKDSENKPPCKMNCSYPLLVLSKCGRKFEEESIQFQETQVPNSQVQASDNDPITDIPKPNNQVQASNNTPCLDSNDVDMIENGSKLEDTTVPVQEIETPNNESQVSNNDAIMAECGSMLEENTIQLPEIQNSDRQDEMSNNIPCSYSNDISMEEAKAVILMYDCRNVIKPNKNHTSETKLENGIEKDNITNNQKKKENKRVE